MRLGDTIAPPPEPAKMRLSQLGPREIEAWRGYAAAAIASCVDSDTTAPAIVSFASEVATRMMQAELEAEI